MTARSTRRLRLLLAAAAFVGVVTFIGWRVAADRDPTPLLGRWTHPGCCAVTFNADGTMAEEEGPSLGKPPRGFRRWFRRGNEIFIGVGSYAYFYWQRVAWSRSPDGQRLRLTFYREPNGIVAEANVTDYQRE